MKTIRTDIAVLGAGGMGLRAAIAMTEAVPGQCTTHYDLGVRGNTPVAVVVGAAALSGAVAAAAYLLPI